MEKRKKILVIDDDPTITKLLASRLDANFYDVITAADGIEGLEKFRRQKPDLIILDILMPRMDGHAFALEFKKIADLKTTPIIILTVKDDMQEIFRMEGINDYIVKPFLMNDLLRKIEKHLKSPVRKILIVDDAADSIELVEELLQLRGYKIIKAIDGFEGLELAQKERPDLVLLDVMMPKLDGYHVCRMIKFDDKYKDISIIIVTAKAQDKDKTIGSEVGASEYLTKPFNSDELLSKVKKLIWD